MTNNYKILKKNKENAIDSLIEKDGITAQFTARQVIQHEIQLNKQVLEMEGNIELHEAKTSNILSNNPFLATLTEEQMHATHMYFESMAFIKGAKDKVKEIEKVLRQYKKEKAEIEKQTGVKFEDVKLDATK